MKCWANHGGTCGVVGHARKQCSFPHSSCPCSSQFMHVNASPPHHPHGSNHLVSAGVEFSGRSCAGINEINFKGMAESVSTNYQQLTFDSAFCQVETLDEKTREVVAASPGESNLVSSLGEVSKPRSVSTKLPHARTIVSARTLTPYPRPSSLSSVHVSLVLLCLPSLHEAGVVVWGVV